MTIYTNKPIEKKEEKKDPGPKIYVEPTVEKKENEPAYVTVPPTLVALNGRRRRSNCANICVLLTALIVLTIGILGGIYLYKHLAHRTFRGWCGVRYYEYQEEIPTHGRQFDRYHRHKQMGSFEERIELDKYDGKYEMIDVPEFDDCKRATILHDFEMNQTAIVDRDHYRCFVMPLNRTIVKPPKDFWDMISKLSSGYYMPDVEVVRERYRVVLPPVQNLGMYGYYIMRECHRFNTYRLEKMMPNDPIAMVKRSIEARSIKKHRHLVAKHLQNALVFPIAGDHWMLKAEIYGL